MKQIIDGRLYDTDAATKVGEWFNHHLPGDFRRVDEALYRTERGAWFLHGEGGPLSPYAVPVGNNGHGAGEAITPLTDEQARQWAERHLDADEVLALWPDGVAVA